MDRTKNKFCTHAFVNNVLCFMLINHVCALCTMEDVIVISESDESDGGRNFDNIKDGEVQFADASFEKVNKI